jgi:uncharacterized RDD family membrane protein YckC
MTMTTPEDPFQPPQEGTPPAPAPPPSSDYPAAPPPPEYGAPPPQYGAPPPQYGAPPPQYGTPPPAYQGGPGYGPPPPRGDYANWGLRVGSALIDYVGIGILAVIFILAHVLVLGYLLDLVAFVWGLYNGYLGGQTGQSYGKRIVGTRLIREADGAYIGGGAGIGRVFVHILDGIPCYLGYLWPLWDSKRQTFADKIMGTIVVKV